MENATKYMDDKQLYAVGFFEGFILSATNPSAAMQLPETKEMGSAFLDGVAEGIAQHQRKMLMDTNDFTRS